MLKKLFSWTLVLGLLCVFCVGSVGCGGKQKSLDENSVEREMDRADEANRELEN